MTTQDYKRPKGLKVVKIVVKHEYVPEASKFKHDYQKKVHPGFKEYTKLMNQYAIRISKLRKIDIESVKRRLREELVKSGFNIPKQIQSNTKKAKLLRERDTKRKALQRAISKIAAQNPNLKLKDREEKAKELLVKKKRNRTPAGKQEILREKVIVSLDNIAIQFNARQLGMSEPNDCLKKINALIISIKKYS